MLSRIFRRRSPGWLIPGGAVALAFAFGAYGCLLSPGSNPGPSPAAAGTTSGGASPSPAATLSPGPTQTPSSSAAPSTSSGGSPSTSPTAMVQMVTNSSGQPAFSPLNLTIAPGTTIWFVNETSMPHTVTPFATGSWTSLSLSPTVGASASLTLTSTGSFPYYCQFHLAESNMQATISVQ